MGLRLPPLTMDWSLNEDLETRKVLTPGHSTTTSKSEQKEENKPSHRHDKKRRNSLQPKVKASQEGQQVDSTATPGGAQPQIKEERQADSTTTAVVPQPQVKGEQQMDATAAPVSLWYRPWNIIRFLLKVAVWPVIFGTALGYFLSNPIPNAQPHPSSKSVLGSRDLAVAKSHSDAISLALNRLPLIPSLDNAQNKISFDELRTAILDVGTELSQGVQQVDLLGSFIGYRLSPSIIVAVHTGNCSRFVSTRPLVQEAQLRFRGTRDSFKDTLLLCGNALSLLRAARSGAQQRLDSTDKGMRTVFGIWRTETGKEPGEAKRQRFAEMKTGQDILDDAIESLLMAREIVSDKVKRYDRSSADFVILIEILDGMTELGRPTESFGSDGHCGMEAEAFERRFMEAGSEAASDDEGIESFEDNYNAL